MNIRRGLAILLVPLTTALVVVLGGQPGSHRRPGTGNSASAAAVFVQDPYMGVSCHTANSIACDRVGLSVWLPRPAAVTATIGGAPLRLDDPHWSYATRQGRKPLYVYAGFLQPAGITTRFHVVPIAGATWLGADAPDPLVSFRIDYGHGDVVTTQEHVWLSAGWG